MKYESEKELNSDDLFLLTTARESLFRAYAPYSRFRVAAAIRLASGKIVTGTNQENVAFPSGLCAERVAFFAAGHQFPEEKFESVAIIARSEDFNMDHAAAPCGACRQVMLEYRLKQTEPVRVILAGESGSILIVKDVKDLLPLYFHEDALKKGE